MSLPRDVRSHAEEQTPPCWGTSCLPVGVESLSGIAGSGCFEPVAQCAPVPLSHAPTPAHSERGCLTVDREVWLVGHYPTPSRLASGYQLRPKFHRPRKAQGASASSRPRSCWIVYSIHRASSCSPEYREGSARQGRRVRTSAAISKTRGVGYHLGTSGGFGRSLRSREGCYHDTKTMGMCFHTTGPEGQCQDSRSLAGPLRNPRHAVRGVPTGVEEAALCDPQPIRQ